MSIFSSK